MTKEQKNEAAQAIVKKIENDAVKKRYWRAFQIRLHGGRIGNTTRTYFRGIG
jgi:hypothetical protein